jgi:uncharacterized protein (DUF952 family)
VPLVYKVVSQQEWTDAERDGVFLGAAIDLRDGYIHLSDSKQVEQTVALYFAERDDLVLLTLEAGRLGEALKWEPSRGGALFPHLYGKLPLHDIVSVRRFSSREPGWLQKPTAAGD